MPSWGRRLGETFSLSRVVRDKQREGECKFAVNDKAISFYVRNPSGFRLEIGCGGIEVDDNWTLTTSASPTSGGTATPTKTLRESGVPLDLSWTDELGELTLDADILVNHAGVQHVAPIEEFEPQRFAFMLRLMVEAPFLLNRAVLPYMYGRGWGRIVHVSGVHGVRASACKSRVRHCQTRARGALESRRPRRRHSRSHQQLRVPGLLTDPLVERQQLEDQARVHSLTREEVVSTVLLQRSALKRMLEPSEVAGAIAYLCSPAATSITGTRLVLDGGWTAS